MNANGLLEIVDRKQDSIRNRMTVEQIAEAQRLSQRLVACRNQWGSKPARSHYFAQADYCSADILIRNRFTPNHRGMTPKEEQRAEIHGT